MPSITEFFSQLFRPTQSKINNQQSTIALTTGLRETDNTFYPGANMSSLYRSRYDYDRQTILSECLRSWRINPIARRIVKLVSMFVVGEGITIKSDHKATDDYLQLWWNHPLNKLGRQCVNFMDEATRSGNLFFLCTPDQATGMLYIRAVPADQVSEIITAPNDIRQELAYQPVDVTAEPWEAYRPWTIDNRPSFTVNGPSSPFMLHYAFNQPVGVAWGEPDLAPMLPWIGRYSAWLEDRARLNRYRNAFLFIWKRKWGSEAERQAKDSQLAASPPQPGTWLLLDPEETIEMPTPNLDSADAERDGLALKKMIALGAGVPTHYLAEPESSTRTTAEAAGTPTFRGLEQTQQFFLDILSEIAQIAVDFRKQYDRRVNPSSKIEAIGPDITERDNSQLALAVSRIYPAMSELYDRDGISDVELLRMVYRMAGESAPPPNPPPPGSHMKVRPLKPVTTGQAATGKPGQPAGGSPPKDPGEPDQTAPSDEGTA
jgi:hypothetical protein